MSLKSALLLSFRKRRKVWLYPETQRELDGITDFQKYDKRRNKKYMPELCYLLDVCSTEEWNLLTGHSIVHFENNTNTTSVLQYFLEAFSWKFYVRNLETEKFCAYLKYYFYPCSGPVLTACQLLNRIPMFSPVICLFII